MLMWKRTEDWHVVNHHVSKRDISPCAKPDAYATFYANVTNHLYSKKFIVGEYSESQQCTVAVAVRIAGVVGSLPFSTLLLFL